MARATKITILICWLLTIAGLVTMLVFGIQNYNQTQNYKQQLNNTYQNNFYSLSDGVNNIENNLSKFNISSNDKMKERYLIEIVSLCQGAQNNLSSLPLEHNSLSNTYKFVNQLGGYCYSISQKLSKGEKLTTDDEAQLEDLHESAVQIKQDLTKLSSIINSGYSIVDNIQNPNVNQNKFSGEWNGMYDDTIEYPTLIYDGPFSDSTENKTVQGLSDKDCSQTEAKILVENLFKDWKVTIAGESKGKDFETWNFDLLSKQNTGYAQVTKKGGLLIQFSSDINSKEQNKTSQECKTLAKQFALGAGIKSFDIVWSMETDGFVYCNLVSVQEGVTIYPDMIKAKISTQDGQICGWEAKSYAFNHKLRTNLTPKKSESEARQVLDKNMNVLTSKLCIIPAEYVGENLAWEFKCLLNEDVFYVYVDANNLQELNIMKVVQTSDGLLLQ